LFNVGLAAPFWFVETVSFAVVCWLLLAVHDLAVGCIAVFVVVFCDNVAVVFARFHLTGFHSSRY
jgi:hypothetical protein